MQFAPHLRFARIDDRVIVLDLQADRYRRLSAPLSKLVIAAQRDGLQCHDEAALHAAGLLAAAGPASPLGAVALPRAAEAALTQAQRRTRPHGIAAALASLSRSRIALRAGGFARAIARAERLREAGHSQADGVRAVAVALAFDAARRWFPFRRRCLPDGLALHALLCRHRLPCALVIGVRDRPFAAHCWVQAGPWLLTDDLDTIAELTPILVI